MKKNKIKTHFKPYSIAQRRKTTINNAFASALAPTDNYDIKKVNEAIKTLGQNPNDDLYCVYCGKDAKTWDHIFNLVKDGQFSGYGHQLGNLLPCCKDCNSQKGPKNWKDFLNKKISDPEKRKATQQKIEEYISKFRFKSFSSKDIEMISPEDMQKYNRIKDEIIELMEEADKIAKRIREKLKNTVASR